MANASKGDEEASVLRRLADAEHGPGWLAVCEEAERFLVVTPELARVVAATLQDLGQPILEVAAGRGELAAALAAEGVAVTATDRHPPTGSAVLACDAREALTQYRPRTVLGSFVPFDAGIDEAVLQTQEVEYYLVLNARIGGQLGSDALWRTAGWSARQLQTIERRMLTRHDVWMGEGRPILRHGEAWLFTRTARPAEADD